MDHLNSRMDLRLGINDLEVVVLTQRTWSRKVHVRFCVRLIVM